MELPDMSAPNLAQYPKRLIQHSSMLETPSIGTWIYYIPKKFQRYLYFRDKDEELVLLDAKMIVCVVKQWPRIRKEIAK